MEWPLQQLGVIGSPRSEMFRLEIAVRSDGAKDEFCCLHDPDKVGTFARVFAGQLKHGGFRLPLAIKVQRDAALRMELAQSVAAKFDCERRAYLRLESPDGRETGIVRHHDFASPEDIYALRIPPAILCKHAVHAIESICPECDAALVERLSADNEDRALICPNCCGSKSYANQAAVKQMLIDAAVRRSPACEGCQKSKEECSRSAQFLNFFPARLLTFEKLDLDLADFLRVFDEPGLRNHHSAFWTICKLPDRGDKAARLAGLLSIFQGIVAGVRRLHDLNITHYDLKPNNICLQASEGRPLVRLIDLGFADVQEKELAYLRQVQGERRVESDYAAPELERPTISIAGARLTRQGQMVVATIRQAPVGATSGFDPLVISGDRVSFSNRDNTWAGTVKRSAVKNGQLLLDLAVPEFPQKTPTETFTLDIRRACGPAGDLYSLGVILLEMLTGETNIAGMRAVLPGLLDAFLANPPDGPLTPAALAEVFARLPAAKNSFGPLFDRLKSRFDNANRMVAEELFGVALRLVYRHAATPLESYVSSRSGETSQALTRLLADLHLFAILLERERDQQTTEGDRKSQCAESQRFRTALETVPPKPRSSGPTMDYNPRLFEYALRLATVAPALAESSRRQLLAKYQGDSLTLIRHLKAFEKQGDATGLGDVDFDFEPLADVLRLTASQNANSQSIADLRVLTKHVQKMLVDDKVRDSERKRLEPWLQEAGHTLKLAEVFDAACQTVKLFIERINNVFIRPPLSNDRDEDELQPLMFRMGYAMRSRLGEQDADEAISRLEKLFAHSQTIFEGLKKRWESALAAWEAQLPSKIRNSLMTHSETARGHGKELARDFESWQQQYSSLLRRLKRFLADVDAEIVQPWDAAPRTSLFGWPKPAAFRLDSDTIKWYEKVRPMEVLSSFKNLHLGRVVEVQAFLLFDRCRMMTHFRMQRSASTV